MADKAAITSTTHINFRGTAREALGFYHTVFGGHLNLVTNKDGGQEHAPEEADQIIWGQVADGKGFRVMGYDVPSKMPWQAGENAYFIAVESETPEQIVDHWNRLSEGATIVQAIGPAKWSTMYGMLKDRFGVMWALSVVQPYDSNAAAS